MEDGELASRLAAGDGEAISALFTFYAPGLIAYAASLLQSTEDGEDVVLGLIGKWIEKPPLIGGPLRPFLRRSVRNAVVDAVRDRRRQTGMHPRASASATVAPDRRKKGPLVPRAPDETPEEFHSICTEALASLSQSDQDVLELAYTRTLSVKERAAEANKSIGAYDKQLHDARERLKKAIARVRARRIAAIAEAKEQT